MKVIVCGAGDVGRHLAEVLSGQGHGVTMVDIRAEALRKFEELIDVRSITGSSADAAVLRDAGVEKCDLLVAATNQDEINLLTGTIAKRMGARRAIVRIHHKAYIDRASLDYAKYLDLDHLICPEHLTAQVIARTLSNPGARAIERFAGEKIEMQQYVVPPQSPTAGVPLSQLELPAGVRLATIERGDEAFVPHANSALKVGDIVTVIGETRHFETVRKVLHQPKRATSNVVIMGGTSMAVWLSRALKGQAFSVRLFETDRERAQELSEKLEHVTVLQADPTDPVVFREEHLENCNAFVAVSNNDEHNILGALQARELGAQLTVAVITQPKYLTLLEHVGIDHPFSPRVVAAKEVLRLIDESPVKRLATIAEGVADVYELTHARNGSAVGKQLKDIKLPKGAFVAAVQRQDDVRVPGADDTIQSGDGLIVIGPRKIERQLRDLFIGK